MNFSLFGKLKKFGITPDFLLVILGNLWIWRMFSKNPIVALSSFIASWFLYRSLKNHKLYGLFIVGLIILAIFQIRQTEIYSLTYLTEQEKVVQIRRLNEYPPVKLNLWGKIVWIPLPHWLEERPEALILYRIQKNLSDAVSPNLYFFSNHPNERVGIKEDEKFPYLLLPFFIIGLLGIEFRKNKTLLFFSVIVPLALVSLIGDKVDSEPITMFPLMGVCSVFGIEYIKGLVRKLKSPTLRNLLPAIFICLYILIFLQTMLYDRY